VFGVIYSRCSTHRSAALPDAVFGAHMVGTCITRVEVRVEARVEVRVEARVEVSDELVNRNPPSSSASPSSPSSLKGPGLSRRSLLSRGDTCLILIALGETLPLPLPPPLPLPLPFAEGPLPVYMGPTVVREPSALIGMTVRSDTLIEDELLPPPLLPPTPLLLLPLLL
jgi:hypothetical protein